MKTSLFFLILLFPIFVIAQNVGINDDGSAPDPGAILDINSSDKGILIPRIETTAVTAPKEGMLVYQPSDQSFHYYKSGAWEKINAGSGGASFETTSNNLIRSTGSNIDSEDFIIGKTSIPSYQFLTDKFFYFDQSYGAFRGGKLTNSQAWAPINIGENSFAYGENVLVDGDNSFSLGESNSVTGNNGSFAFGLNDTITASQASGALGWRNHVAGTNSCIAIGGDNTINGNFGTVAIGSLNTNTGRTGSLALGNRNTITGNTGSIALGHFNTVSGDVGAIAIGSQLKNPINASVVVGYQNDTSTYAANPPRFSVGNSFKDAFFVGQNGLVGINETLPTSMLEISNNGDDSSQGINVTGHFSNEQVHHFLDNNNTGGKNWGWISTGGSSSLGQGKFILQDASLGKEWLAVTSNGNIGIGTVNPLVKLEVKTIQPTNDGIVVDGHTGTENVLLTLKNNNANGHNYRMMSTGGASTFGAGNFIIRDLTDGENRFSINDLGNVGINYDDPLFRLALTTRAVVNDGIALAGDPATRHLQMRFENNANNAHHYNLFSTGGASPFGAGKFILRDITKQKDRMILDSLGNFGFGILNPDEMLHVDGAVIIGEALTNKNGTVQYFNDDFFGKTISGWKSLTDVGQISALEDADMDTKILVEETTDEDKINFYAEGTKLFEMGESNGKPYLDMPGDNLIIGRDVVGFNAQDNTFLGANAGNESNGVSNNVYVGFRAGRLNTSNSNVAVGFDAITNGDAENSVVVGYQAGKNSDEIITALGYNAGLENTTGENNTFIGYAAGEKIETGNDNTIIGDYAGPRAVGSETARDNTIVGRDAGNNFDVSGTTFIGSETDCNSNINFGSIAIGYSALVTSNDQARIGNSFTSSIGGYAGWSNISDGRVKKNIRETVPGLSFIKKLRPVNYTIDVRAIENITQPKSSILNDPHYQQEKNGRENQIHTGFIAQEVERVANDLQFEFSGIDKPKNNKDTYSLRYAEFVVPLVKAVQEQQEQIETLQQQVEALTKLIDKK